MKLDSEKQRDQLFQMLSTVTATVTWDNARVTADEFDNLKNAIQTAEIEKSATERDIIPIGDLAPDMPTNAGVIALLSGADRESAGLR